MTRLSVPSRHRRVLSALTSLPQEQVDELSQAIMGSDGSEDTLRDLIHVDDPDTAVDALVALNATRLTHGIDAKRALVQVNDSLGDDAGGADLTPLLENPVLVRLAKSADLATANERQMHLARIITDIRPVFKENATESIESVLVAQTLQLMYLRDGKFEEIYISLDYEDLQQIQDQVVRALEKRETARDFAQRAGARMLTPREGE